MDFFKAKQPIALPIDSADEKLLKSGEEFDPELAANVPQQQEPAKRCCRFKKGTRGRKVIRRLGHFVVLGAFFYWLWGPTVKFNRAGHELHDFQFSDFTDLDEVPNVVPDDFLWAEFDSDEKLECDVHAEWSEPKKIKHPCKHRHPKHPGGPEHPPPPGGPEPPHHPGEPEPPHPPGAPHELDHPHEPDHPHKPGHPHRPGPPHKPDHPHKPGHPHWPHFPKPGPHHRRRHGPKYTSDATFKLPLSDSALLFYSHGPFAFGGIKFHQDDSDSLSSDEVEVTINAKIWDKSALELAKVCTLKREHGSGLGIWTEPIKHEKPQERNKHKLALGISVKFPKHPDTLELQKLQTHMPLFGHFFKDADLKVKDLEVGSFFFPIKSEALSVDRGHIRTDNSPIVGNFTASEILLLETRNAPVAVNVTLFNDPEKKLLDEHSDFSKVFIKTANAPLYSNISLVSTAQDHSGGKFLVGAFSSNGPLHVTFADAPVDSNLHFKAFTTNSPAIAFMHPTFQGDFVVKSTLFGPKLDVNPDVLDPSGEGRPRTVDSAKVGKEIVGKVYWGTEEESKDAFGHAELGSSLLRALLKL